jgi:lipopolysaccharide export system protein LptA
VTRALLAAMLLLAPGAFAQGLDLSRGGPIDITAEDGIEWRQDQRVIVARGGARAMRDGITVNASRLIARYRGGEGEAPSAGTSQIWRIEAEGAVRITTAAETAVAERAVFDMDQAVLVLSGGAPGLTTAQSRITARDSLEYWTQRRMAVARGNALVVMADGRRLTADTLVAYMPPENARPTPAARPANAPPGQGQVDRVELFGNVEIRTADEVVRGDRGVYSAETGMARLLGNVRITRGQNQVNGQEALVNMNTGVATLVGGGTQRVQGLITPGTQAPATQGSPR